MKSNKRLTCLKGIALAIAVLGITSVSNTAIANMQVSSHGGLCVFDPAESSYWFKIGGLLQLDETLFSGKATAKRHDFPNGANIRRSWLDFRGGVGDCWSYRLTLDFRSDPVIIREAYLNFSGIEQTNIAVGQVFVPFGLENWGCKQNLLFLEQSLMTTAFLAPEFGLGFYVDTNFCDMFTIAAAVYQPRQASRNFGIDSRIFTIIGDPEENNVFRVRNDRVGEAVRITFSPFHCEDTVYHFGASVKNQRLFDRTFNGLFVRTNIFQTIPEGLGRTTATLVNAGRHRVTRFAVGGLEAAAMWGPLMVQAEYNKSKMKLHRDPFRNPTVFGNPSFWGWHVQAAYVLTGESHCYDFCTGTFGGVVPETDCGAWEVAARYSAVDLIDKHVYGGRENNVTLGLNFYVNENVKIQFNYVRANIHPTNTNIRFDRVDANTPFDRAISTAGTKPPFADAHKRRLDIFGLRFQAAFY